MNFNKIVLASVVFAIALGSPCYSIAEPKPVSGKKAASVVRANKVDKPGKMVAQSNRRAPNRKSDKGIAKRMKEMRLPVISFKPPATIVDAVEFFRTASKDYDSPDVPIEERGFNFVLRVSADVNASAGFAGVPVVPPIFANDIAFDEALNLVCDSVGYMYKVQSGTIIVMPTSFGEIEQRDYSIRPSFAKILDSLCHSGHEADSLENVFSHLGGVDWPAGAMVSRVKSSGKIVVRNTYENIAKFEKVLAAFKATVSPLTPPNMRSSNKAAEQAVVKRMKEMRLPTISFKPPATIADAVEFFCAASKDYGRSDIPIEKRGLNFALKPPVGKVGWPIIPAITASDIRFYEALKLVCESVEYKFTVRGNVVVVGDADYNEIEFRAYPLRSSFIKSMGSTDSGRGAAKRGVNNEPMYLDWREFFSKLGVMWPNGSMIFYIQSAGMLYIRNTPENISILERSLKKMKAF